MNIVVKEKPRQTS